MIRAAAVEDVPAILALIRELAVFEREPVSIVENTEDAIRATLFGADPAVWALVAEDDAGTVVGTAIWFLSYSTWTGRLGMFLEDLIVAEDARGGGHGAALFDALVRICRDKGYGRFEWRMLDWNSGAGGFYESRGATLLSDWVTWRLVP